MTTPAMMPKRRTLCSVRRPISKHAGLRMQEFELTPDDLEQIITAGNSYPHESNQVHYLGDWAVVVSPEGRVVTVLRRTMERWEHTA